MPPGSARRAISSPTQLGAPSPKLAELGPARGGASREVIVAVGPAFGTALTRTIGELDARRVLAAILTGVAERRADRAHRSRSTTARIARRSAMPARSSAARASRIGIQSRGTTMIQKRGLARLQQPGAVPAIAQPDARNLSRDRPQRRALCQGRSHDAGAGAGGQLGAAAADRQDHAAAPPRNRRDQRSPAGRAGFDWEPDV